MPAFSRLRFQLVAMQANPECPDLRTVRLTLGRDNAWPLLPARIRCQFHLGLCAPASLFPSPILTEPVFATRNQKWRRWQDSNLRRFLGPNGLANRPDQPGSGTSPLKSFKPLKSFGPCKWLTTCSAISPVNPTLESVENNGRFSFIKSSRSSKTAKRPW